MSQSQQNNNQPAPQPQNGPTGNLNPTYLWQLFITFLKYPDIKGVPLFNNLNSLGISTTQQAYKHGLGQIPNVVILSPTSNGIVWQSQAADNTYIYLKGSTSFTCNVAVAYIKNKTR